MKPNSKKWHLLVSGHKNECLIAKISASQVIETHIVKLLGVHIDSDLTFENHLKTVCKKASQKLNALSRLCSFIPFKQPKTIMQAFFISRFSYCPLVWMFHSRKLNTKINNLHFRALRMIYRDETFSFKALLEKDGSVTIHHSNLQYLAIELYKVFNGTAPAILNNLFRKKGNAGTTESVSNNTRSGSTFYNSSNPKTVKFGLETLRVLGPKIWDIIPEEVKRAPSLLLFKSKIKTWEPYNCPGRLCKTFVPQLGFLGAI